MNTGSMLHTEVTFKLTPCTDSKMIRVNIFGTRNSSWFGFEIIHFYDQKSKTKIKESQRRSSGNGENNSAADSFSLPLGSKLDDYTYIYLHLKLKVFLINTSYYLAFRPSTLLCFHVIHTYTTQGIGVKSRGQLWDDREI